MAWKRIRGSMPGGRRRSKATIRGEGLRRNSFSASRSPRKVRSPVIAMTPGSFKGPAVRNIRRTIAAQITFSSMAASRVTAVVEDSRFLDHCGPFWAPGTPRPPDRGPRCARAAPRPLRVACAAAWRRRTRSNGSTGRTTSSGSPASAHAHRPNSMPTPTSARKVSKSPCSRPAAASTSCETSPLGAPGPASPRSVRRATMPRPTAPWGSAWSTTSPSRPGRSRPKTASNALLILDWDVHHGNGSSAFVRRRPERPLRLDTPVPLLPRNRRSVGAMDAASGERFHAQRADARRLRRCRVHRGLPANPGPRGPAVSTGFPAGFVRLRRTRR